MKIVTNLLKDARDEWLVKTTASLNEVNPVVDRIIKDESVEGVIMTNKEAANYGTGMQRLGVMTQNSVAEIDLFEEVLVVRLNTKKFEILVVPHSDFNIIVLQHTRTRKKINSPKAQEKLNK